MKERQRGTEIETERDREHFGNLLYHPALPRVLQNYATDMGAPSISDTVLPQTFCSFICLCSHPQTCTMTTLLFLLNRLFVLLTILQTFVSIPIKTGFMATELCLLLAAGSLGCLSRAIMPIRALCTICSDFFDHSRDVAAIHCGHTFHLQW